MAGLAGTSPISSSMAPAAAWPNCFRLSSSVSMMLLADQRRTGPASARQLEHAHRSQQLFRILHQVVGIAGLFMQPFARFLTGYLEKGREIYQLLSGLGLLFGVDCDLPYRGHQPGSGLLG